LRPVSNQVVVRNVSAVAARDEARKTESAHAQMVEDRDAECAALRKHPDITGRRFHRSEGRVETNGRVSVEHAQTVRPHHPHSAASYEFEEPLFSGPARLAGFGKS